MKSRDDRERLFNEDNPDLAKGAVEQDRRSQQTTTSLFCPANCRTEPKTRSSRP